ncbi:MAG: HAD family hydrolase [Gemmatimonadetes bacterium]|nr:HAD family hydrolase [Gemmatimonadota bacterium]NNL29885.1 HAD family hydrolase [Gemmatimonadota bacterium]
MRRLILFDIDGTLVQGGPAKDAFVSAMTEIYGTPGLLEDVSFAGKTDPQIARELLRGAGMPDADIEAGFERLWVKYLVKLEALLPSDPVRVLPGVEALLDALVGYGDVGVGLLTGNIVGGARLKLSSGGLWDHFTFGSYGSDHEERDELPAIAVERARKLYGNVVRSDLAVVVGDTPRDVACGKAGGTRTVAVATGSFSVDDLASSGPDRLLVDLSSTDEVVTALLE